MIIQVELDPILASQRCRHLYRVQIHTYRLLLLGKKIQASNLLRLVLFIDGLVLLISSALIILLDQRTVESFGPAAGKDEWSSL
jgi:hypothetical protein